MDKYKLAIIELLARVPKLTIVVIATLLVPIVIVLTVLAFVYQSPESSTEDRFIDSVQVTREFRPAIRPTAIHPQI